MPEEEEKETLDYTVNTENHSTVNTTVNNPWTVDLDEYLFYFCPQCEVKCKTRINFVDHAYANHAEARDCLDLSHVIKKEITGTQI